MNLGNGPVYVGSAQSQLYELDRAERAFFDILIAQGLPAQRSRDLDTNTTPRIELEFTPQVSQNWRHYLQGEKTTQYLPWNTWDFELSCVIVTNREQNGDSHVPLVGLTRWNWQMSQIKTTWTPLLCPTHRIVDIRESEAPLSVWNDGGLDMTELSFAGIVTIPENAW